MVATKELKKAETAGDYLAVISGVQSLLSENKRAVTDPWVKSWMGKRWRNLFIQEMVKDEEAVKNSKKRGFGKDKRPVQQKVAEQFLRGEGLTEWSLEMPEAQFKAIKNVTLVFCPGLLNGILPSLAFHTALPAIEKEFGWKMIRSDSHPFRGCQANEADLLAAINEGRGQYADASEIPAKKAKAPKDIFLIGYSKGGPDILSLLVHHPELAPRIRCIFGWAAAVGGSVLANDFYEGIKDMQAVEDLPQTITRIAGMLMPNLKFGGALRRLEEYDIKGAMKDLTTHEREAFLQEHSKKIDALNIPMFNLTGATSALEVPYFQVAGYMQIAKYDANNDMQVTQSQAKFPFPMATDLSMLRGHHWDLSYEPFPKSQRMGSPNLEHRFPRRAAMITMFKFAAELGLID